MPADRLEIAVLARPFLRSCRELPPLDRLVDRLRQSLGDQPRIVVQREPTRLERAG